MLVWFGTTWVSTSIIYLGERVVSGVRSPESGSWPCTRARVQQHILWTSDPEKRFLMHKISMIVVLSIRDAGNYIAILIGTSISTRHCWRYADSSLLELETHLILGRRWRSLYSACACATPFHSVLARWNSETLHRFCSRSYPHAIRTPSPLWKIFSPDTKRSNDDPPHRSRVQ